MLNTESKGGRDRKLIRNGEVGRGGGEEEVVNCCRELFEETGKNGNTVGATGAVI
jgi:hypothetical protein